MIVLALMCPLALAEDASETGPDAKSDTSAAKNWEFSLAPMYLWAASIDGDMTIKGVKVDVNESFSDIIEDLDGALTFHFQGVRKQRLEFFADLMYIRLNPKDDSTPIGDLDIDITQILAELGGFYRYSLGAHTFDGLAGLRYSTMKGE